MEEASTDKLSSHTVDERAYAALTQVGAVWKQWQTAAQWSGEVQKHLFSKTETDTHRYMLILSWETKPLNVKDIW